MAWYIFRLIFSCVAVHGRGCGGWEGWRRREHVGAAEDADDTTKLDKAMRMAEELEGFDVDESKWYQEAKRVRAEVQKSVDDVNEVGGVRI